MGKYDGLRKRIDKITEAAKGTAAPIIAYLDKVEDGYKLVISFWNRKTGLDSKTLEPIIQHYSTSAKAEKALLDYLEVNRPYKPFVLFSNEEMMLD